MPRKRIEDAGLPQNRDAELFTLGNILLDDSLYLKVAEELTAADFTLEKDRRIFRRMGDLQARGEPIDYVTLATELQEHGELESADGCTYISSLTDGMPRLSNLGAYVSLVKEAANRRRIIELGNAAIARAMDGTEKPGQIADWCTQQLQTMTPATKNGHVNALARISHTGSSKKPPTLA